MSESSGGATLPSVHIVGTGLIGASLGIALTRAGASVTVEDQSITAASLARDLGAGSVNEPIAPELVVVAAPPDVTPMLVAQALDRWSGAFITDVASVKGVVLADLQRLGVDLGRYVGSHPMAGRERSGAIAARGDLFEGRAWVLCPHDGSDPRATAAVRAIADAVGAAVTTLGAAEHDAAVAAVSHVPQVAASLVAARLEDLTEAAIGLAGPGVRDVTRIAASDPGLWTQILSGNAPAVRTVLADVAADLAEVVTALDDLGDGLDRDAPGARAVLARTIAAGNLGRARIPGKHGSAPTQYAVVSVLVPDEPGQLARLLNDIGEADINIEDLRLEHGLGIPFGVADVAVLPAAQLRLEEELSTRGWQVHD
ncbi:prephenate dehydrogenase [Kribbia dieselivorans]|uniref:prephenate dehydrogenase n=1 Tax=Kribbia dieselivorans TaxID=331526 RepID=UPI000B02F9EF|nr:prephenate dehydrogenase [Kribbia dieselivorans]